jgi:hypothetical protein
LQSHTLNIESGNINVAKSLLGRDKSIGSVGINNFVNEKKNFDIPNNSKPEFELPL